VYIIDSNQKYNYACSINYACQIHMLIAKKNKYPGLLNKTRVLFFIKLKMTISVEYRMQHKINNMVDEL